MCSFIKGETFISISLFSHFRGSIAARVSKPSGGSDDFFEINLSALRKLQKVSGISGKTNRIFIFSFLYLYKLFRFVNNFLCLFLDTRFSLPGSRFSVLDSRCSILDGRDLSPPYKGGIRSYPSRIEYPASIIEYIV